MLWAPPMPPGVPWKAHHHVNGFQYERWPPVHKDSRHTPSTSSLSPGAPLPSPKFACPHHTVKPLSTTPILTGNQESRRETAGSCPDTNPPLHTSPLFIFSLWEGSTLRPACGLAISTGTFDPISLVHKNYPTMASHLANFLNFFFI